MYSFAAAAFFEVIGDMFSDEGGSLSCLKPLLWLLFDDEDSFSPFLSVFFFTESLRAENHDFFSLPPMVNDVGASFWSRVLFLFCPETISVAFVCHPTSRLDGFTTNPNSSDLGDDVFRVTRRCNSSRPLFGSRKTDDKNLERVYYRVVFVF